jgi:uncharacterized protein YndB with AHSA1/START domain
MSTDRIEKQTVLKAPLARVWRAISDSREFGAWFLAKLDGEFTPGARVTGQVTYPGYEHLTMELDVERVEPERLLSLRWHPNATDPDHDYSDEPTTLIEFHLEEVEGGTRLTIIESGFDQIPLARRAEAYRSNDGGWAEQLKNIQRYVEA